MGMGAGGACVWVCVRLHVRMKEEEGCAACAAYVCCAVCDARGRVHDPLTFSVEMLLLLFFRGFSLQ